MGCHNQHSHQGSLALAIYRRRLESSGNFWKDARPTINMYLSFIPFFLSLLLMVLALQVQILLAMPAGFEPAMLDPSFKILTSEKYQSCSSYVSSGSRWFTENFWTESPEQPQLAPTRQSVSKKQNCLS